MNLKHTSLKTCPASTSCLPSPLTCYIIYCVNQVCGISICYPYIKLSICTNLTIYKTLWHPKTHFWIHKNPVKVSRLHFTVEEIEIEWDSAICPILKTLLTQNLVFPQRYDLTCISLVWLTLTICMLTTNRIRTSGANCLV